MIKFEKQHINKDYPAGGFLLPTEGSGIVFDILPNIQFAVSEVCLLDKRWGVYHVDSGTLVTYANTKATAIFRAEIKLNKNLAILQDKIKIALKRKLKFLAYRKKHKLDW